MATQLLARTFAARFRYAGRWRLSGVVTEMGQPGAYRVRLFDTLTGTLVAETVSAADGVYTFTSLANRPYFAVAFDHGADPSTAGISDQLILEAME
jgi:hypothetical protein